MIEEALGITNQMMANQKKQQYKAMMKTINMGVEFVYKGHKVRVSGHDPELVLNSVEKVKEMLPKKLSVDKDAKEKLARD